MNASTREVNPFRPTFGVSPLIWAGRDVVLEDFRDGIEGGPGNPFRAMVISGHRGVGKTVLLSELEDIARQAGWIVLRATGRGDIVKTLIESTIPAAIGDIAPPEKARVTGVNIAGVGGINVDRSGATPEPRPTLESQLRKLCALLPSSGVFITLDEVQDADPEQLSDIAAAFQHLIRDDTNVAISFAGLNHGIDKLLDLPGTTFLRRAQRYNLGPLSADATLRTLTETAAETSITFTDEAANLTARLTHGYPYLVQLFGFLAWKAVSAHKDAGDTSASLIAEDDVHAITPDAISTIGQQVHAPAVRRLRGRQRQYLQVLAEHSIASKAANETPEMETKAVAEALGLTSSTASAHRAALLSKGLIDAPEWGKVRLALPYLAEYLTSEPPRREVN